MGDVTANSRDELKDCLWKGSVADGQTIKVEPQDEDSPNCVASAALLRAKYDPQSYAKRFTLSHWLAFAPPSIFLRAAM